MIYSPLEQFTIIPIIEISKVNIELLKILLIVYIFYIIPSLNKLLSKIIIEFYSMFSLKNYSDHINIYLTIFFFILISNLLGILAYSFTLNAQIIFVWSISIIIFISINLLGVTIHRPFLPNLFGLFLPSGVPLYLVPIISILEFILYIVRVFSLTLRLSANLLAGHILLKILLYSFLNLSLPFLVIIILPIILLEILVACLQAYIYTILISSYYNDIMLSH